MARRIEWVDPEFEKDLAWLAARFGVAIRLRLSDSADTTVSPDRVLPDVPLCGMYYTQGLGGRLAAAASALGTRSAAARAILAGKSDKLGQAVWLNGARAPILVDLIPPGRLIKAEYADAVPTRFTIALAPGKALTLSGLAKHKLESVSMGPVSLPLVAGAGGAWKVDVPALKRPQVVEFRLGPGASVAPTEHRPAPGNPR
jgi:hypothetical protein